MEWLLLALLAPLVLVPVVFLFGFAGCGLDVVGTLSVPTPPTSLEAERTGDRKITLRWTHSDATVKFRISRGESSGSLVPIPAMQDITGTQVDDINLPEGTTFFYAISAVNAAGPSALFSSSASSATTRPAAPSNLVATPGVNSVALTWKNNSSKATRFVLERFGFKVDVTQSSGTPPSYTDSGVTPNTTYEYRLRAFVEGANKGVAERVVSTSDVTAITQTLVATYNTVFPPSPAGTVPLTNDQSVPGFCFVQRIGADRLVNGGNQVRVTIRGALSGSLTLTAITISHAVAVGEAWDSAAPVVSLGTNVVVPAGTPVVLPPVAFALDETKPLLIAFDVSTNPSQGNVRYGLVTDPQTKMYFKPAAQQAQLADRTSDFQPSNSVYLIEKIEAA